MSNYIPTQLKAIAYGATEGGKIKPWPTKILGSLYSQDIPNVQVKHTHKAVIRFPSFIILQAKTGRIESTYTMHYVYFERGYMWDALNGWRQNRLTDVEYSVMLDNLNLWGEA